MIKRFLIVGMLLCSLVGQATASQRPFILAVHPYLPVSEIKQRFGPLAEYLAAKIGREVQVRVGGSYSQHIEAIGKDLVDIAFLGPIPYVQLTRKYGTKPLLSRFQIGEDPYLYGVIAVREESEIQHLAELEDARFAFVQPESTMGYIVPRHMMEQAGVKGGVPARHRFLGSHHNTALGVLAGDFDGGAMKREVYEQFKPQGLRLLALSPGVPDHLFVTRADMPEELVNSLKEAMLQLVRHPGGEYILSQLKHSLSALVPVSDEEYDPLRKMASHFEVSKP